MTTKLRPADELIIALLVVTLLELRRAGDQAAKIRALAAEAAADPTLWERVKDNAYNALLSRFLFK